MRFLNGYGELKSVDPESWVAALGVSALCLSGAGVVSIVSLSAMLFMFPFENITVSSFIPDDRKWASGAIADAAAEVVEGVATKKTAASGVDSFLGVTGWLVASFASSLFISLLFSFGVPVFCFR